MLGGNFINDAMAGTDAPKAAGLARKQARKGSHGLCILKGDVAESRHFVWLQPLRYTLILDIIAALSLGASSSLDE